MQGADRMAITAAALSERDRPPLSSPLAGLVVCLSIGAALLGGPSRALAEDVDPPSFPPVAWTITGSVSERIEADTNRDLRGAPSAVYGSTTSFGLDIGAVTPTTQWQIRPSLTGSVYGGPGDTSGLNRINPSLDTAVAHNGKHVDTDARFHVGTQPVAFAELDRTGITSGDATELSVNFAGNAAYALDPRNRLSLGGTADLVRFTQGTTSLTPITTLGLTSAWIRDISPATRSNVTFGVRRFTAENSQNPTSYTFNLSGGASHQVNGRLSVDATLGLSATRTTRTLAGRQDDSFDVGAIADLGLSWQPRADTSFSVAISHGLEPSALGELQTTTALDAGVGYVVNPRIRTALAVAIGHQKSAGGFTANGTDHDFATVAPTISFALSRDWALQAGYILRLDRRNDLDAASNRVFLTLTRQFDILP